MEEDQEILITDSAEELAKLWTNLVTFKAIEGPTHTAISNWFGVKNEPIIYLRLLGVLAARIDRLSKTIEYTDHPMVAKDYREQLLQGLAAMGVVIAPARSLINWSETRKEIHIAQITLVGSFSHIARAYQPLRLISSDEAGELVNRIELSLSGLVVDVDMPPWAKQIIRSALYELKLTMKYFPYFGHEWAVEEIIKLKEKTAFVETALPAHTKRPSSLIVAANLVVFAMNLIAVPPHAQEYIGWYTDQATSFYQNFQAEPQKHGGPPLLSPPMKKEEVMEDSVSQCSELESE